MSALKEVIIWHVSMHSSLHICCKCIVLPSDYLHVMEDVTTGTRWIDNVFPYCEKRKCKISGDNSKG